MLTDSFSNLLTLAESSADPAALHCPPSLLEWYKMGGIASTIIDFWPGLMATKIVLTAHTPRAKGDRSERSASKKDQGLIDWLQKRYKQLQLLQTLKAAETQCQFAAAAPILMSTNNSGVIDRLTILDPAWVDRIRSSEDGRVVKAYEVQYPFKMMVPAEAVLPLYARKFTALEWMDEYNTALRWGRPLIDEQTMRAALAYEAANHAGAILIQKKNYITMSVKGYLKNMAGVGNEQYAANINKMLRLMQKTTNLLNVQVIDLEEMEVASIERNVSGIDSLIDRIRDMLLASCNNIPESRLFGRNRVGGISASNDDDERSDLEADRLFNDRWVPLIEQLNERLFMEPDCPASATVEIGRESSYRPKPLESARARLINLQADQLAQRPTTPRSETC